MSSSSDSSELKAGGRTAGSIILIWAAVVPVLHAVAMIAPGGMNWGFHQLAFLPPVFAFLLLFCMIAVSIPAVRRGFSGTLASLSAVLQRISRGGRIAAACAGLAFAGGMFWLFRERVFLLGDGDVIFRTLPLIHSSADIAGYFPYEPVAGYLTWLASGVGGSPQNAVQMFSVACGIAALVILARLAMIVSDDPVERILFWLSVAGAGSVQLYFGYVESYPQLTVALLLFVWLAAQYLRGHIHPVLPAVSFGILLTLHLGMLCLVPAYLLLPVVSLRRGRTGDALFSVAVAGMTVMAMLLICGYSPVMLLDVVWKSQKHLLSSEVVQNPFRAYSALSVAHLLDAANAQMLIAPFALLLLVTACVRGWRSMGIGNPDRLFLLLLSAGGLGFLLLFNFDMGMSRDWDLLAGYELAVVIAASWLWLLSGDDRTARVNLMAAVVLVTVIHTVSWVTVNADETRAVNRFSVLPDQRLWGRKPTTAACEELAILYRSRHDPAKSMEWYRRFCAVDSTNGRIWSSMSYLCRLDGDREHEVEYAVRASRLGTADWTMYWTAAGSAYENGAYPDAIDLLARADSLHPNAAGIYYLRGLVLMNGRHELPAALQAFMKAISLDPGDAAAWRQAGECSFRSGDIPSAKYYWRRYLDLAGSSPESAEVRATLQKLR